MFRYQGSIVTKKNEAEADSKAIMIPDNECYNALDFLKKDMKGSIRVGRRKT
jgi:hypothetical protein